MVWQKEHNNGSISFGWTSLPIIVYSCNQAEVQLQVEFYIYICLSFLSYNSLSPSTHTSSCSMATECLCFLWSPKGPLLAVYYTYQ